LSAGSWGILLGLGLVVDVFEAFEEAESGFTRVA
jgi:hypothetical protein